MLPPFRVCNLRRPPTPATSRLSVTDSPISYLDGIVRISALQYDKIISVHQSTKLTYVDEDDGEIVTVGSSLELAQRLEEPVVLAKLKLRSMPVTMAMCSADLKQSAETPLLHVFEIESFGNSLNVWQEIVRNSGQTIAGCGTFEEIQNSECGAPKESNEPKASGVFQPSEPFRLQAHRMKPVASARNHRTLRLNTHFEDPIPVSRVSVSPYLERYFSEEAVSPYMGHNIGDSLSGTQICHEAPPLPCMERDGYETKAPAPIYKEMVSPYMNNDRATQIAETILHSQTDFARHSEVSSDHKPVPGGWRSYAAPPHQFRPEQPAGDMNWVEHPQNKELKTQSQSDEQSSLLQLFEAELARLWKNPDRSKLSSCCYTETYADEHYDSSTVEKVQECVEKLKDLGFGENSAGGAQRLVVYAQAAEGNLSDAIDLIDEEQQAYKKWDWAGH